MDRRLPHVAGALGSTAKLLRHRIWRTLTVNYGVCMEMVCMTEAELQQDFRALADRARREPVTITAPDGRDEFVVLSAEEYARLKRRDRRVGLTEELPEEWVEAVRNAKVPDEFAALDAELK
jgi:PHD/YefM family antitoxin component YafN of YafNO toxin-antitoxin module